MMNATWRQDAFHFKADPAQVYAELRSIGNEIQPEQIVDFARNEDTELHKCFTWDDTAAAEKWRIQEARTVMHCLVVNKDDSGKKIEPFRVFYNVGGDGRCYKPTEVIVRNEDSYQQLLAQAWAELERFKNKYSMLTELKDIFELIA